MKQSFLIDNELKEKKNYHNIVIKCGETNILTFGLYQKCYKTESCSGLPSNGDDLMTAKQLNVLG